ncbi:hypothetical protein TVAG_438200 [Trichomonas vaginalis G3]|uniref:Uncharacterized protein n=1 Tax=Trichomonas vaginalis (strain ATCC PRA-98 / G3) TaxID=412133 RepID=A2EYL8_TRIV3|nr:GTPase activation domain, GAP family [Trichomonas vaginalis G3]EAY02231.1 hypothetical protein TVAG_438200 [Trichomonas vaginalis G3]KAI5507300.1 GTPase activation domain, GAP family [Trichomonas vaginalis G3]|eukprot:XP_001314569.1 hypothetical protein [Trichomonas vaginalis G3]
MSDTDSSESSSNKEKPAQPVLPKTIAFRNYSLLDPDFERDYYNKFYTPSYYFVNDTVDKSLDNISQIIEFTPLNQIIKDPPELISKFKSYILNLIPQQSYSDVLNQWPPIFPSKSLQSRPLFKLLLKLVKLSRKPDKIFAWFISDVFNRINVVINNKKPLLSSAILITKSRLTTYAMLDEKMYLHIYTQSNPKKRSLTSLFNEKAVRAIPSEDGSTITITGPLANVINTITLRKKELVTPFCQSFSKKPPHFYIFMSDIQNPIPKPMYDAILQSLINDDGIALRALAAPETIPNEHKVKVFIAILDIGASTGCLISMLSTIFSAIFELPDASIKFLTGPESIILTLSQATAIRFKGNFQETFITELASYLTENKDINLFEKPKEFEDCLFTCLDKILTTIDQIPKPIRLVCSMIQNFACLRFNNRETVWALVGFFLGSFLHILLDQIAMKNQESQKIIREIGKLVRLTFTANEFFPKYALPGWNERLSSEFKPKLYIFLANVCKVPPDVQFGDPPKSHIKIGIEEIIRVIAEPKINQKICESIRKITEGEVLHTTALSWAVAASISMQFSLNQEMVAPNYPEVLSLAPLIKPNNEASGYAALVDPKESEKQNIKISSDQKEAEKEESSDSPGLKIDQNVAKTAEPDYSYYSYYSDEYETDDKDEESDSKKVVVSVVSVDPTKKPVVNDKENAQDEDSIQSYSDV